MPDYTYHPLLKPLLFRLRPEAGRQVTLWLLATQGASAAGRRLFRFFGHGLPDPALSANLFGLHFPSRVGLGPLVDPKGLALSVMQDLGFGFVVVGPVGLQKTPGAFETEPLRISHAHALVSSLDYGMPSAEDVAAHIRGVKGLVSPVGVLLREDEPDLIVDTVRVLRDVAGFFILPESAGADTGLLRAVKARAGTPVLLRLGVMTGDDVLTRLVDNALQAGLDGAVLGGGEPVSLLPSGEAEYPELLAFTLSTIRNIHQIAGDAFPIIGSCGVYTPQNALAVLDAGAALVELNAGLVFTGPGLPGRIIHALESRIANPDQPIPSAVPDYDVVLPPTATHPALLGWGYVAFTGVALTIAGVFALILAFTIKLLPYDFDYLQTTYQQLCSYKGGRIGGFLTHDRVSFGGSIISVGLLYVWLASWPIRQGKSWGWWTALFSGIIGFGSFLTYIGYGYLDSWHGLATLALLPVFIGGMAGSYRFLHQPRGLRSIFQITNQAWLWSPAGRARMLLTFTAGGMILGGIIIMVVGMTHVFVPQDLDYMNVTVGYLNQINPRLMPLIAHDRSGFGGGIASTGIVIMAIIWFGLQPGDKRQWQFLALAGFVGFACAVIIHPVVGYTSFIHLLPAVLGAIAFFAGMALLFRPMCRVDRVGGDFRDY